MEYQYDAYCGLYCGVCDVLQANQEGRHAEMATQAGNTPENYVCRGCKTTQVSQWCGTCAIRQCAQEQGVEWCLMCRKFPCEDWMQFFTNPQFAAYHKHARRNMEDILAHGKETWLEQQARYWRCAACGHPIAWTDTVCRQCGSELPCDNTDAETAP